MWSALSAVGKATGLVSADPVEQPPFPCAAPLRKLADVSDLMTVKVMDDENFLGAMSLIEATDWEPVDYTDPEAADGGDLRLLSRKQIGTYHMLKATMTIRNCTPENFLKVIHSDELADRQKYSADCIGHNVIHRITLGRTQAQVQHSQFWAPPPVAGRDFVFLVGRRNLGDGNWVIYGCSIDMPELPEASYTVVRGYCMWCWHLSTVGADTVVTYVNCIDPRGWTPGFLFAWLKTAAAKEIVAVRTVMSGKTVALDKTEFGEVGMSQEAVAEAYKKDGN